MAILNAASLGAQTVQIAANFVAEGSACLRAMASMVLGQGENARRIPRPPGGGVTTPPASGELAAPTDKTARYVEVNPTRERQSETVQVGDLDMVRMAEGVLPLVVQEQLTAIIRDVDTYGMGTPEAGGFAAPVVVANAANPPQMVSGGAAPNAAAAIRLLRTQMRRQGVQFEGGTVSLILDDDDYSELLGVDAVQNASFRGDSGTVRSGEISDYLGFGNIYSSGNVQDHTSGTATGAHAVNNASGYPAGYDGFIAEDGGAGNYNVGDAVRFGGTTGHDYTYIVAEVNAGNTGIRLTVPLTRSVANDVPILKVGASGGRYRRNLAFPRGALALASRVLPTANTGSVLRTSAQAAPGLPAFGLRMIQVTQPRGIQIAFDYVLDRVVLQPRAVTVLGTAT